MSFSTSDYRFAIIPFGSAGDARQCPHEFEWHLDEPLIESGILPSLNSAPLSSWFIARLRRLDGTVPGEVSEHNDGGGYCFEMAVAEGKAVVAAFQLQGDMEGVAALGRAKDPKTADQILNQLIQLMTESADEVADCCYTIVDPEWEAEPDCFVPTPDDDSRNEYGWRDGLYLGANNVREE